MPSEWVEQIIEASENPEKAICAIADNAKTSLIASMISVVGKLKDSYVISIAYNQTNTITVKSSNCIANVNVNNINIHDLNKMSTLFGTTKTTNGYELSWWKFGGSDAFETIIEEGSICAKDILLKIVNSHISDSKKTSRTIQIINGIVGAAKSMRAPKNENECFAMLKARFVGREELNEIVNDKDFLVFLKKKSKEIMNKIG